MANTPNRQISSNLLSNYLVLGSRRSTDIGSHRIAIFGYDMSFLAAEWTI